MAKVVFIHNVREHLGLEYLSSILKKAGHNVYLVYDPGLFSYNDNAFYSPFLEKIFDKTDKIVKEVLEINPDIVGFSVYTSNYSWAKKISSLIKNNIDAKIVFGGIHPTFFPEKVLQDADIDFIIRGEGEEALLELVENLNNKKVYSCIKNLCYREGKDIIVNELRPLINNLDSLPFPDKELFSGYVDYFSYIILTQRGCVFNCSFCCEAPLRKLYNKEKCFRKRSVNSVIEELSYMLNKYRYKEVIFFDSDFLIDKPWVKRFLPVYKKAIHKPFKFMCRVSNFDEEMAVLVKNSGCYNINFGIQSWNEHVRRELLNREETDEEIKRALNLCEKYGLNYDIDLIFDIPGDSREDYLKSLDYLCGRRLLNRVKCFKLAYFPMAELTRKFYAQGLISIEDIRKIEEGRFADTIHNSLNLSRLFYRDIEVFYKILPLLPFSLRKWMLQANRYMILRFVPSFLVYLLQGLSAFKKKDWRFLVYLRNFLKRVFK